MRSVGGKGIDMSVLRGDEMDLRGMAVNHKIFGEGIVKNILEEQDGKYLVVAFSQGEKKFVYPDAFEAYISVNNSNVAEFLKIEIEKRKKIKAVIESRRIECLMHFTCVDNLSSILINGLVPVDTQQEKGIRSVRNDSQRVDSRLDCTSCSISFPNYKLFYKFRNMFSGLNWVVIVLNKEILFSPTNTVYYCQTNAASVLPRISDEKELCKASAFEKMFCDSLITQENKRIERTALEISDCMTTDPQAEILISGVIDKKYIKNIYFEKQDDMKTYIRNDEENLLSEYNHQVLPDYFKPRNDFRFWQKES